MRTFWQKPLPRVSQELFASWCTRTRPDLFRKKSTSLNIRRLYLNLQIPSDCQGSRAVCSLDAAKAVYSVEWPFLWTVLQEVGFGSAFISWIKLFYTLPQARQLINGQQSDSFGLGRGTCQGCPRSPLLFSIAIEPLVAFIRTTAGVRRLRRGPFRR